MSIDIKITKTVTLTAEEAKSVPAVSYYANGSEWESITITYGYDLEAEAWEVIHSRGSIWRLTAKGNRVKNSLSRGNFPGIPNDIVRKYMPTEEIAVIVLEEGK